IGVATFFAPYAPTWSARSVSIVTKRRLRATAGGVAAGGLEHAAAARRTRIAAGRITRCPVRDGGREPPPSPRRVVGPSACKRPPARSGRGGESRNPDLKRAL